jgi:hypothetical protein
MSDQKLQNSEYVLEMERAIAEEEAAMKKLQEAVLQLQIAADNATQVREKLVNVVVNVALQGRSHILFNILSTTLY